MHYIKHTSWKELADFSFSSVTTSIPDNVQTIFTHNDELVECLKAIADKPENQYILISGNSDFGVSLQTENPVAGDMAKWLRMASVPEDMGYQPFIIPSRHELGKCRIDDVFSLKMYSWTKRTFSWFPTNIVHWFGVNIDIPDHCLPCKVTRIPFGIPDWILPHLCTETEKEDKIYVGFSFNTINRLELWRALKNFSIATVTDEVSHEDYAKAIAKHKIVLCPEGNGLDSFRILETLYSGSIPMVPDKPWASAYDRFPVVKANMESMESIIAAYKIVTNNWLEYKIRVEYCKRYLDIGHWQSIIASYSYDLDNF